ncbi:MAG: hypothetical protein WCP21_12635, partial [Armatimonadota bacterium]
MMKKVAWLVVALLGLTAVLHAAGTKVVVEAEKYVSITPSMTKGADGTASGGYYVGIPLARPHATTEGAPKDQGKAVYRVTI